MITRFQFIFTFIKTCEGKMYNNNSIHLTHTCLSDPFYDIDVPSYEAYFFVQSCAVSVYFFLSVLKMRAISGTSGSSGFGSVSREHIDKRTENRKKKQHINH